MTKLEELLEWMDSAEYAPTYGELREKVKSLITDEQQVKSVDLADVGKSCNHQYVPFGCGFDKVCKVCGIVAPVE